MKHWVIKNNAVTNRFTKETCEFGLNGQLYNVPDSTDSEGFSVVITNTVIAQALILANKTAYTTDTALIQGDELVIKDINIKELSYYRKLLDIPSLKNQLAMANSL